MSSVADFAAVTPSKRTRRIGRWVWIVVVSLIAHLILLDALPRWTPDPVDDRQDSEPLHATLMPPIRPVDEPPASAIVPAQPPSRPRTTKAPTTAFVPESFDAVPEVQVAPPATIDRPQKAAVTPVTSPPEPIPEPPPAVVSPPTIPATAPRSARLSYKVVSVDTKNAEPTRYYGVGAIDWSIADGRYRGDLQASLQLLFVKVGVLASHSEGTITASGIAPDRYTESPRKRATVATNFNRDARQSVTFSSSQASVPLMPGTQDRLSVLFQIGALLLASPQQPPTGARIEMPVAGVRGEVETWAFESQGIESIETGAGTLSTTHLRRSPRPGTNDRTIDVWIAQQDGGYPARVLYTEPGGSTIEMTLTAIGAADPAAPLE